MTKFFWSIFSFAIFVLSGCAFDVISINQVPTEFTQVKDTRPSFELKDNVNITLGTGYRRTLENGTKWHYVNSLTQGDIFKTTDQILTIEGSNIFEAFIVVSQEKLVGFYLPVEETYSPLKEPITLPLAEINK